MNKLYQRINWQNYPSDSTPLNESNLNKMDAAVDGIDDRVVTLDVTKLPVATANTMVKDVTFNESTGVFTITKLNGTKVTVNTALEKIATNFRYDYSTQKLILTLIDETTQEVDLTALLTQYEFLDSDTIAFTISSDGKVSASVKNGSITGDMLEPNYLANVTLQASKADTSAKNAKESEEKAAEYAENAKNSADSAEPVASTATGINPTIQDSTNAPLIYGKFKGYTLQDGEPTPDNPVEINGLAKDGAIEVGTTGILGEETTASIPTDAPLYEGDYLEVYADGSGKLVRAMAEVVFDGSSDETWYLEQTCFMMFGFANKNDVKNTAISTHFVGQKALVGWNTLANGKCQNYDNAIGFKKTDLTTVAEWKAWLQSNPVTAVYELAEPTETPLTAEQVEQFKQLYTFEPVTNVLCDGEVEMRYYKANVNGETVGMLQGMVEKSNETVGMLQEMVEKSNETVGMLQNRKVILLTDSYGVVNGDNSWCYKFAEYLGLVLNKDIFISAIESTGFHSNCLYTFTGNLKNMSIPEPNKITDVVVCGGMNDVYYNTESELLSVPNAIASFVSIAKNKFPNAQIRIGFIGNSYNNTYIGNKNDTNNTPIQKAILMYKQCVKYGAKYLNNVEYCLRNNSLFIDDMVHPNADGAQWLAQYVANSFLNGSADINAMNLLGITWESDIAYKENFNLYTYLDNNVCGIILNPTDFNAQISTYPNKRSLPTTVNTMYDYKLGVLTNSFIIGSWNGFNRANIDICASLFTSDGVNNIVRLSASLVVSTGNLYISFIVPDEYVGGYINGIFLNQCNLMCDTLNN